MLQPVLNGHFAKLSSGLVVPQKEAMKYEALRVASFHTFPKSVPQSALKLANAGFYYYGKNDEVECFDCMLKLKDWGPNDDPFEVHKRYSVECPYINNNDPDNVPLASRGVNEDSVKAAATQFGRLSTNNGPKEMAHASMAQGDVSKESDPKSSTPINSASNPKSDSQELKGRGNLTQFQSQNPSVPGVNSNPAVRQAPTFNPARSSVPGTTSSTLFPQPQLESRHDYRYERSGLASFQNWPSNAAVRPEELAKSGFYYTGTDDRVQCTFCRGILRNWEPSDQADAEHRRHFGQCPFLVSPFNVGNIPLGQENEPPQNDPDFQDNCQSIVTDRPVHQRYSLPADRLGTYKDFPSNVAQTPEQFARAGFYYSGISDQVRCFFCDGGLRNWEPNDDPWTEHARWFPRCGYLRLCKGDEFIKEVQGRYAPPCHHRIFQHLRNASNRPKHPVNSKKVLEHLKSRIVTSVLEMGYDKEKVKIVIRRRMEDLGDDFFPNYESLLDAILEYEDELKYVEVYGEEEETEEQTNDNPSETATENTNGLDNMYINVCHMQGTCGNGRKYFNIYDTDPPDNEMECEEDEANCSIEETQIPEVLKKQFPPCGGMRG